MKKKYLLYTILVFFAFYGNIFAISAGQPSSPTEGEGGNNSTLPEVDLGKIGTDSSGNSYSCKYKYRITTGGTITINTYNKDNELTNPNSFTPTEETLAGTSIGMQIYETKTVTWNVPSITVAVTSGATYDCQSNKKICNCNSGRSQLIASIKNFRPIIKDENCCDYDYLYNQNYCPSGYTIVRIRNNSNTREITSGEYYDKCKKLAEDATQKKATMTLYPSYIVKLQNPNDVNSKETTNITSNACNTSGARVSSCTFTYDVAKTCINVKTAAIRYLTNTSSECSNEEIEVKKNDNHWSYFIPLNAKSKDDYFISITSSGKNTKYSGSACKNFINQNANYTDWIITSDEKKFTGNISKDLSLASAGCYLSSIVTIPVNQKFYSEEEDSLKGYSFYYRPIDINNPFPNGVDDSSYWSNWYKSKNKEPDIAKSFAKITYYTGNINTPSIREYNKAYKYTSWSDMNISGLSNFITDAMRINVNKKEIYKLGCGPLNKDWSECKK